VRARAPRFSTSYDQQPVGSLKYVASLPVRTAEPVGLLRSLSSLLQICFICFFSCEQWRLPACIGAPYQTIRTTSTAAAVLYMVNLNFAALFVFIVGRLITGAKERKTKGIIVVPSTCTKIMISHRDVHITEIPQLLNSCGNSGIWERSFKTPEYLSV